MFVATPSLVEGMANPYHSFGIHDVVDISVVAYIIYRMLLLIRGALALRVITCLSSLFLLYFAAQLADLTILHWIIDNFLASFILIPIIIFQADIRRALLAFPKPAAHDADSDEIAELVAELTAAVEFLSSRTIGALIVMERAVSIEPFIEVGTEIDAKVTGELITSIFLPYSPIHDGAVIIQNGKLTKAGCLLPLSRNPDIDKGYGTRHRAALGLTEVVDAVVLVVSEESGSISIVSGGEITSNIELSALSRMLRSNLEPTPAWGM